MPTHVLILAAGQGKRMHSPLPKVAHLIAGRPMVRWVIEAALPLNPVSIVVVVGHGADQVVNLLPAGVIPALQAEQLGTGHAAQIGLAALGDVGDDDVVVILYGDTPLLTDDLLGRLAALDAEAGRVITAKVGDPAGYGRVIRDSSGDVVAIVEDRDCTEEQRQIDEINAGLYAIRAADLSRALAQLNAENAQGEYYLTDVVGILVATGRRMVAVEASAVEVAGINSQAQLAESRKVIQGRINRRLMESGVNLIDPERTYIDEGVEVAPGATIYPGVHIEGTTSVASGCRIGPDTFIVDSQIGRDSRVWYAVVRSSKIGSGCEVGPYASLRPGTELGDGAKLGTFVETKNAVLEPGAKAGHLSYLGDVKVGARTNIGAGTVTVNYDGYEKHHTEIGSDVFIGSDTMLVAPVKVGDGAVTGAGSVITQDVSDGALAIERNEQKEIPGYAERRKARRAKQDAED